MEEKENKEYKNEGGKKENFSVGHRQRLKKKYKNIGMEAFTEQEKIEFLLFHTISRKDTKDIAYRLMKTFGGFSGVFDANYEDLCAVEGLGPKSAELIKIVSHIIMTYMNDKRTVKKYITNSDEAIEFIKYQFIEEEKECIYLICMSSNGKILSNQRVAEGSPETVSVVPSDLMKRALRANATKIIIAHNHPNGISSPSSQDLRTTSILYDEFQRIDIELVDHIIIASDGAYSMKKNRMFPAGSIRF